MKRRAGESIQPSTSRLRNVRLATFLLSTKDDKPSLFKIGL